MVTRHDSAPINGWSVGTLKEHIIKLMDERDRQYQNLFAAKTELGKMAEEATEKALEIAEKTMERELANMKADICRLGDDVETLDRNYASTEGRHTGIGAMVAYVIGSIGIILALLSLVLRAFGI